MPENEAATPEVRQSKLPESKKSSKNQESFLLLLIVIVVAAGVFILYRNGAIGGSAGREPVEKYLNAICDRDFEAFVSTMPDRIAEVHRSDREELGLSGEEYMRELYSDYFEEFGDDMTVAVEFTGKSRPSAVYVDNFRQSYSELYGEEIDISSVFEIDVTARFSGGKSADDVELEFFVIRTDGKWRVVGADYKTEEAEEE